MTIARREIVADGEVGAYHCIARCVRRAFLCGKDELTGKSFDHRKQWVRDRLEQLAGVFAIDVGGFAVMDNHLHVILRVRPDVVEHWSAEEVTGMWRSIFGKRPVTPKERTSLKMQIEIESADEKLVALRRNRLTNVSWFMKALVEPIARWANKEDDCKGRFWEGRFRCQALLDDAAVLTCSAYVDLNPVRAGKAKTPESSKFISAADRISQRQKPTKSADESRDGWLSPMPNGRATTAGSKTSRAKTPKMDRKSIRAKPARRASNDEWISLPLDDYLQLLDWTGRQIRLDKRGAIPNDLSPILDRLKIQPTAFVEVVSNFGRWFKYAAGSTEKMRQRAKATHRSWFQGLTNCQTAFG